MTEGEWITCNDPMPMLRHLTQAVSLASDRKLRLFACAVARECLSDILARDEYFAAAVARSEKAADAGEAPEVSGEWIVSERDAALAARLAVQDIVRHRPGSLVTASAILRDIFGNPFRLVRHTRKSESGGLFATELEVPGIDRHCLTSTVAALAHAIYDERAFDRMPVLADALEEAGCRDKHILAHCRGRLLLTNNIAAQHCEVGPDGWMWWRDIGPHVRGCWALDLILGKE